MYLITAEVRERWIETLQGQGMSEDEAERITTSIGSDPRIAVRDPLNHEQMKEAIEMTTKVLQEVPWEETSLPATDQAAVVEALVTNLRETVGTPAGGATQEVSAGADDFGFSNAARRGVNTEISDTDDSSNSQPPLDADEDLTVEQIRNLIEAANLPEHHLEALRDHIERQLHDS